MNKKHTRIPAAAELVEAVAEFMEKELLPTLEGSKQFNTRVSINALRIVQRELTEPIGQMVIAELKNLLGSAADSDDLEKLMLDLAERIRSGKIDENDPILLAVLRLHTLERLAVDNPKYSSYVAARERGE